MKEFSNKDLIFLLFIEKEKFYFTNPLTEEGLEKIVAKVIKKIETNHKELEEIKNNMISREDFEKAISNFNKKIKKMENEITNVKEELAEVKLERDDLKSTVLEIRGRIEIEEKQKKRKNIIIHGLNTPETSNLEEEVKEVVNKLKIKIDIKNIKKIGSTNNGPICVRIPSEADRVKVFKNCFKLKEFKISITPDYTKKTMADRKILNIKRLELIQKGKAPKLKNDKLFCEKECYAVNNNGQVYNVALRN